MKVAVILSLILLLFNTKVDSNEALEFDYKCLLCKWTSQLIITYHAEGAEPHRLFNLLVTLCSYLGEINSVSVLIISLTNFTNQKFNHS